MAILDPLYGTPLAVQLIPQVDRNFAEHLKLRDDQRSIGLISVDNDDATYTAIDEATKMANVEVVYARSFYAGAKHTSGKWSGEIMAILAGPDPAEVRSGWFSGCPRPAGAVFLRWARCPPPAAFPCARLVVSIFAPADLGSLTVPGAPR